MWSSQLLWRLNIFRPQSIQNQDLYFGSCCRWSTSSRPLVSLPWQCLTSSLGCSHYFWLKLLNIWLLITKSIPHLLERLDILQFYSNLGVEINLEKHVNMALCPLRLRHFREKWRRGWRKMQWSVSRTECLSSTAGVSGGEGVRQMEICNKSIITKPARLFSSSGWRLASVVVSIRKGDIRRISARHFFEGSQELSSPRNNTFRVWQNTQRKRR